MLKFQIKLSRKNIKTLHDVMEPLVKALIFPMMRLKHQQLIQHRMADKQFNITSAVEMSRKMSIDEDVKR